jgi:hypothetical protein
MKNLAKFFFIGDLLLAGFVVPLAFFHQALLVRLPFNRAMALVWAGVTSAARTVMSAGMAASAAAKIVFVFTVASWIPGAPAASP